MHFLKTLAVAATLIGTQAQAQSCGGDFGSFIGGLKTEAVSMGYDRALVDRFFRRCQPRSLRSSLPTGDKASSSARFLDFSRALISQNRLDNGIRNYERYRAVFDAAERQFGVNPGILLSFWAFETDFGAVQGDFNTVNALVTLAHDCRRPELFRPQVFRGAGNAPPGRSGPAQHDRRLGG